MGSRFTVEPFIQLPELTVWLCHTPWISFWSSLSATFHLALVGMTDGQGSRAAAIHAAHLRGRVLVLVSPGTMRVVLHGCFLSD